MKSIFYGSGVALITPFRDGKIDYESLGELIDFQVHNGTSAIIILGTTGESATINKTERQYIIKLARNLIPSHVKLIVGCGTNNLVTTLQNVLEAQALGADGVLVVTPHYNKCTQEGLVLHYSILNNLSNIPIIVYNVPTRTGLNIEPKTMLRISRLKHIAGIKEANGDISHILKMFHTLKDRVAIYSGNDNLNYIFHKLGAQGCISVTANILPKELSQQFSDGGDYDLHDRLYRINELLFCEVNPIPVKYVLSEMNMCANELRLPLTPLAKKYQNKIKKELIKLNLIDT